MYCEKNVFKHWSDLQECSCVTEVANDPKPSDALQIH